ncbi:hypothetical protein HK097_004600 [Rhizophlyctis rosea]|uniref:Uncharacterized protein n=1 Tax=Rhizophlyctis rosea TaxID=64517 RepID=A0AAD5SKZ4_9FUNG|nr:hypothetical protein HK097_004600 [Rhizophlyctis rosea]
MSTSTPQNPSQPSHTSSTPVVPQQHPPTPATTSSQHLTSAAFTQHQSGPITPWTNPRDKPSVYGKPDDPPVTAGDYQARILRANKEDQDRLTWLEKRLINPWRPGKLFYAWAIFSASVVGLFLLNAGQVYQKEQRVLYLLEERKRLRAEVAELVQLQKASA